MYKTVYKERTVYVPVYDDPFWNPEADGRVAGEVCVCVCVEGRGGVGVGIDQLYFLRWWADGWADGEGGGRGRRERVR